MAGRRVEIDGTTYTVYISDAEGFMEYLHWGAGNVNETAIWADNSHTVNVKLEDNIDMINYEQDVLPGQTYIFNGNNKTISNLHYNSTTNNWFIVQSVMTKNLYLKDVAATGINYVAPIYCHGSFSLAGTEGRCDNVHITGNLTCIDNGNTNAYCVGIAWIDGLYGRYDSGNLTCHKCSFSGTLRGYNVILLALHSYTYNIRIEECFSSAKAYGSNIYLWGYRDGNCNLVVSNSFAICEVHPTIKFHGALYKDSHLTASSNYFYVTNQEELYNFQGTQQLSLDTWDIFVVNENAEQPISSAGKIVTLEQIKDRNWLKEQGWAI